MTSLIDVLGLLVALGVVAASLAVIERMSR